MQQIIFNDGWAYRKLDSEDNFRQITVPYDCMLYENRSENSEGGCNNAWFEGYDYEFIKSFELGAETCGKRIFLEFEGIYHKAEIYCNDVRAGYRPNGYLGLIVDITALVREGTNRLKVISRGADIPNSRWYTGAGIYRPVYMYIADKQHICLNGLKIHTVSVDPAVIQVGLHTQGCGSAEIFVYYDGKEVAFGKTFSDGQAELQLLIPAAKLWSPDKPELYRCRVKFGNDVKEERFGIRRIQCDAENGLRINGRRVILRGACLHHDNGLLGAVSLPEAEERKIRILRSCGFNAVRSAHNPCSKALLDACDKLGVLVMDEYADSWYVHKTKHDYATYLQDWYEQDLRDMVDKDYNHPCVVLYSLGNEVTETAEARGVFLYRKMQETLKKYDKTRPVTCGINIGFNQAALRGHSFFSEEKAQKNDYKNLGTEKANHRKWMFGPLFTKLNAMLPGCDRATKEIFSAMDVAGYNYGILRYRWDRRKYPQRVILGSESFCEDAERFMKLASRDKAIIGDFVWTGFDHLGEVGLGSWEYRDYAPTYLHTVGWLTSGSGRIDITGKPLPEAYYMKAAFGLLKKPFIAVRPVNHRGERHSPSGWKFTDAVSSWAWAGCEGRKADVEVYACGAFVELYLNAKCVGRKSLKRRCRVKFTVRYRRGALTAIVYDSNHNEIGRNSISSAESGTEIRIEPEEPSAVCGKLSYIRLRLTDGNGTTKVLERKKISILVEGGELVGLGHACPYNEDGYVKTETQTYFGEALAIVRPLIAGKMTVMAIAENCRAAVEINVM